MTCSKKVDTHNSILPFVECKVASTIVAQILTTCFGTKKSQIAYIFVSLTTKKIIFYYIHFKIVIRYCLKISHKNNFINNKNYTTSDRFRK